MSGQIRWFVSPTFPGTCRNEVGARSKFRIVQLLARGIVLVMFGVFPAQERALMMIEPPGQARVGGVLEVHDGVFIAIEQRVLEYLGGFVRHARIGKLCIRMDPVLHKTAEVGRRRSSVETVIVVQDSHQHESL